MTRVFQDYPVLLAVPVVTLLAIANIPREIHRGRDFRSFLSSSAAIIGMPLVIAYTFGVHWVFRGKVRLDETSY